MEFIGAQMRPPLMHIFLYKRRWPSCSYDPAFSDWNHIFLHSTSQGESRYEQDKSAMLLRPHKTKDGLLDVFERHCKLYKAPYASREIC